MARQSFSEIGWPWSPAPNQNKLSTGLYVSRYILSTNNLKEANPFLSCSWLRLEASIYIIILVKYDLEPWPEMNRPRHGGVRRATVKRAVCRGRRVRHSSGMRKKVAAAKDWSLSKNGWRYWLEAYLYPIFGAESSSSFFRDCRDVFIAISKNVAGQVRRID